MTYLNDLSVQFRASYGTLHSTVKRHLCFRALKGTVYSTVQRLGFIQSSSTVHSSEKVGFMLHRAQFYSPVRDSLVYSTAQRNVSRWVIRYIFFRTVQRQYVLDFYSTVLQYSFETVGLCHTRDSLTVQLRDSTFMLHMVQFSIHGQRNTVQLRNNVIWYSTVTT